MKSACFISRPKRHPNTRESSPVGKYIDVFSYVYDTFTTETIDLTHPPNSARRYWLPIYCPGKGNVSTSTRETSTALNGGGRQKLSSLQL